MSPPPRVCARVDRLLRRHGVGDGRAARPRPISFSLSIRSFFSPPPLFLARAFLSFSLAVLDRSNGIIISWRVWFPSVSDSLVAPSPARARSRSCQAPSQTAVRLALPPPIVRRDRRLHYWFPKMAAAVAAMPEVQLSTLAPPPPPTFNVGAHCNVTAHGALDGFALADLSFHPSERGRSNF